MKFWATKFRCRQEWEKDLNAKTQRREDAKGRNFLVPFCFFVSLRLRGFALKVFVSSPSKAVWR